MTRLNGIKVNRYKPVENQVGEIIQILEEIMDENMDIAHTQMFVNIGRAIKLLKKAVKE